MKTKSKCIGCSSIKLVNTLGLCKRCNRHAHDFISTKEMERIKLEREMLLSATKAAKQAKKEEEEAKAKEAAEEGKEEGEEEGEEVEGGEVEADADAKEQKDEDK